MLLTLWYDGGSTTGYIQSEKSLAFWERECAHQFDTVLYSIC